MGIPSSLGRLLTPSTEIFTTTLKKYKGKEVREPLVFITLAAQGLARVVKACTRGSPTNVDSLTNDRRINKVLTLYIYLYFFPESEIKLNNFDTSILDNIMKDTSSYYCYSRILSPEKQSCLSV